MEHGEHFPKPEGNLLKAALGSGFNFASIMKEFANNMGAASGGGGGGGDKALADLLSKPFSNIFENA